MTKISVIIPCYNQGEYLQEALDSVLNQTYQNYEIILVNDGSTDEKTNEFISQIKDERIKVLNTKNQGLAEARNNGISKARGEYILPLDADDKIGQEYMELAIKAFDNHPKIGIVYCEAQLFGLGKAKWILPEYSFNRILINNVIFCSAFFRKKNWEEAGGYNSAMKYGWEDWNFWLSILKTKKIEVYKIPKILFFYRIKNNSMSISHHEDSQKVIESFSTNLFDHQDLYRNNSKMLYLSMKDFVEKTKKPIFLSTVVLKIKDEEIMRVENILDLSNSKIFKINFSFQNIQIINQLVFQPVCYQYCRLKIDQITIISKEKEERFSWLELKDQLQTNGIIDEQQRINFSTKYPQIILPYTGIISKIIIEGEMEIIDSDIIIEAKNKEISQLQDSTAYKVGCLLTAVPKNIYLKIKKLLK